MQSRSSITRLLLPVLAAATFAIFLGHGCERYEVQQPVNNPPTAPVNPSPANDTTNAISSLTPQLSWEGGEDVDDDAVAVFDQRDGPSYLRLGRDVADDEAVRAARESSVGD